MYSQEILQQQQILGSVYSEPIDPGQGRRHSIGWSCRWEIIRYMPCTDPETVLTLPFQPLNGDGRAHGLFREIFPQRHPKEGVSRKAIAARDTPRVV